MLGRARAREKGRERKGTRQIRESLLRIPTRTLLRALAGLRRTAGRVRQGRAPETRTRVRVTAPTNQHSVLDRRVSVVHPSGLQHPRTIFALSSQLPPRIRVNLAITPSPTQPRYAGRRAVVSLLLEPPPPPPLQPSPKPQARGTHQSMTCRTRRTSRVHSCARSTEIVSRGRHPFRRMHSLLKVLNSPLSNNRERRDGRAEEC